MNDPLDLAEPAEAAKSAGIDTMLAQMGGDGFFLRWPDRETHDWVRREEIESEHPRLAFAFRDAVRSVMPGSYVKPVSCFGPGGVVVLELRLFFGTGSGMTPTNLPSYITGGPETECWARALVALFRAGLIGEGRC